MTGTNDQPARRQSNGADLDPRTILITAVTVAAIVAAVHSSALAAGIGTGFTVLLALNELIGRRRR